MVLLFAGIVNPIINLFTNVFLNLQEYALDDEIFMQMMITAAGIRLLIIEF